MLKKRKSYVSPVKRAAIEERWKLDNILELDYSTNLIAELARMGLRMGRNKASPRNDRIRQKLELVSSRKQVVIRLAYFGSSKTRNSSCSARSYS